MSDTRKHPDCPEATLPEQAKAHRLGQAAHARGAVRAPGVDGDLLTLIGDVPVGQPRTVQLMRVWSAAYDALIDREAREVLDA